MYNYYLRFIRTLTTMIPTIAAKRDQRLMTNDTQVTSTTKVFTDKQGVLGKKV